MPDPSTPLRFGRYDGAAFLTFFSYASATVAIPVALVLLATDLGFPLGEGGMGAGGALHLGRSAAMMCAMALCGFAAGRWGTRQVLGVSVLLAGGGLLLCAFAPGYGILFLALLLAGTGEGIVEGLATPFVRDLHPDEPGRYITFTHSFWSVGVLVTVLASGALLAWGVSWRTILAGIAGLWVLAGALLLLRSRSGQRYPDAPHRTHGRHILGHAGTVVRHRRFWLYFAAMVLAGGSEFVLTYWAASHLQIRYGASAWGGGLGTAFFAGGMMLGRTVWGYTLRQHRIRWLLMGSAFGGAGVAVFLPFAGSAGVFFGLLFLCGVATAPFWPGVQGHAVDQLRGTDSTMLLILLSCAGIPGCGIFTYAAGVIGNRTGNLGDALWLVPLCYLGIGLLLALDRPASSDAPAIPDASGGTDGAEALHAASMASADPVFPKKTGD